MADDLRLLLDGMGETADEIADFLRGQGCQGSPWLPWACPVMVYLLRHFPESQVSVRYSKTLRWDGKTEESVSNPPPVLQFIHNFDTGLYPDLIRAVKT